MLRIVHYVSRLVKLLHKIASQDPQDLLCQSCHYLFPVYFAVALVFDCAITFVIKGTISSFQNRIVVSD